LLATDGSEDAALAARAAVDLATQSASELHAVYVAHKAPTTYGVVPPPGTDGLLEAEARKEVGRWIRVAGGVARAHPRVGRVVAEILSVAEEIGADLLVVGARGHGALHRAVLGSVSEGLAHRARVPVLVVRGEEGWPPKRIVVGDDASGPAKVATEVAAAIGALYAAEVDLVRAQEGIAILVRARRSANEERLVHEATREAGEGLDGRPGELTVPGGRGPRTETFAGEPATSILRAAEGGAQPVPVVVGSGGSRKTGHARLGSTLNKVLRGARGSVLVDPRSQGAEAGPGNYGDTPPEASGQPKLLLATDGSYSSLRAAEHAVYPAVALGGKLYTVYVVDDHPAFRADFHYGEAATLAAEASVEHEEILAEGHPERAIVEVAEEVEADYGVVGSHGEAPVARALVGSVFDGVLHHAKRPVLIVDGGARRPPHAPGRPNEEVCA